VVHLSEERRPVPLDAFDDRELPERLGRVERILILKGGEVEQISAARSAGMAMRRTW
jgi:hypothetical protein